MSTLKHYRQDAPRSLSDILIYEIDPRWSRDGGEFAPTSENIPMGAVLCLDGEGSYVPFGTELSPAVEAREGVEAKPAVIADQPCAILISREMEASDKAQPCVIVKRGVCVASRNLHWLDTVTDAQKKTALAALNSLGIVVKE